VTVPNQHSATKHQKNSENAAEMAWQHAFHTVDANLPPNQFAGVKVVLAVSGGADSVAMLHLVHALWRSRDRYDASLLTVAHYNHSLRGAAANADQAFVSQLAQERSLPFITESASPPTSRANEADFRAARYDFLLKAAESIGARYVLVAHSADDNIETFLHNLLRGSGPAGLAGIAKHRSLGEQVVLYRPLLQLSREQLRAALQEKNLSWREDASNADDRYQRNWIRGKLLPLIHERYPQANKSLSRTIESQSQIHAMLCEEAKRWIQHAVEYRSDEVQLRRSPIARATLSVVVQMVWDQMNWSRQSFTNQHLRRLQEVLVGQSSQAFTLPSDIQCRVGDEFVGLRQGKQRAMASE
jgi:tRNA(Ile)-lysidine synthase